MVKTKSIRTPVDRKNDGLRIFIARFRSRGMPTTLYDVWMPSLGPSEKLLRAFLAGNVSWAEYTRQYNAELFDSSEFDKKNKTIKNHGQKFTLRLLKLLASTGNITLLCHCSEDELQCHRHLLKKAILSNKI